MAYNETKITLVGAVAGPVTHTHVGTGESRAKFRLLTVERHFDQGTRSWENGHRMFLTVTCWRKLADNVHASLNKGDPVVVTGVMRVWEKELEGDLRQFVDVEAGAVGPNLMWCTAEPVRDRSSPDTSAPRRQGPPDIAALIGTSAPEATTAPEAAVPEAAVPEATAAAEEPAGLAASGTAPDTDLDAAPGTAPPEGPASDTTFRDEPTAGVEPRRKPAPEAATQRRKPAPRVVAPRKEDELPLARPATPRRHKEVAEVPF